MYRKLSDVTSVMSRMFQFSFCGVVVVTSSSSTDEVHLEDLTGLLDMNKM